MESTPREKQRVFPAPPARVKDIIGGIFDASEKELQTIYGKIKRAMLVAVITKRDFTPAGESTGGKQTKNRVNLLLDDGSGIIKATWFGVDEDTSKDYDVGDLVKLTARIGEYQNEITLVIDSIKKVSDLNDEFYQRAKILEHLAELKKNGKPLILSNGGRVTNRPDEVSQMFSSKTKIEEDIDSIEEPLSIKENDEGFKFTSNLGRKAKAAEKKSPKKVVEADVGNDEDMEQELEPDNDFIKDTIMETITEPEYADGITLGELQEVTHLERKVIARVLKIMENENMIAKVGSDKYKEK
ncbi:MAG TPA: OB-fold nucleic acid binding domain-containing protein [Candidatus Lokiarchaeia archaeon]|nr:OB-fold nucleic acid binding domain-containing protein [Candidatus Lokiarchaeia archaeon]